MGEVAGVNMTQIVDKRFYRPDEIAEQLCVKTRTIYDWIHKGELIAIKLPSGIYRIKSADLDKFLLYRTTQNNTDCTVS